MNPFRAFWWLFLLFCWVGNEQAYAQTDLEQTLARAQKHIRDAEQYYAAMKYNKAKESYQFAARLYRNNDLPAYYAICYNGIGNIYIDLTRYEKAKSEGFDKALQQLEDMKTIDPKFEIDSALVADAYEGLGRYYSSIATTVATDTGPEIRVHYDRALAYHRAALAIRQRRYGVQDHPKIALSYYYIGKCYRGFSRSSNRHNPLQLELRNLQRALNMQLKTLGGLHYQTANTYQALGNYFYETQQNYHQGYAYHQAALDIRRQIFEPNHPQMATAYLNLATYYGVMNYYDQELEYLEQALQIQLNVLGALHADVARSYYQLANRYRTNGAIEKATGYYQRVLSIYTQLKQQISPEAAYTHLALADCYAQQGNLRAQHQALNLSQQVMEQAVGTNHFSLSDILLKKGDYYLQAQRYDSTLVFYKKALRITHQQLGHQHFAVADAYDHLARYARQTARPERELHYLQQALAIRRAASERSTAAEQSPQAHASYLKEDSRQPNRSVGLQLHNSYRDLSDYYRRQADYTQALDHIQWALATVFESLSGDGGNWKASPSIKELATNVEWLGTLERKAHLLLLLYQQDPKQQEYLTLAYQHYQLGMEVIRQMRTVFQSTKARQELRLLSTPIYEGAIRCLYRLQAAHPNPAHLQAAFQVSESSKGFSLLQNLQHHQARGRGNIPDSLLFQERDLRQRLAYYSNYKNRLASNAQAYDSAYLATKQQYDLLIRQLELQYPTYYDLKYQTRTVELAQVQERLKGRRDVVLEYFLGDDYLYVFRIDADTCWWYEQAIPPQYEKTVYELRSALTNYDLVTEHPKWAYQSFVTASEHFYSLFLAPFLEESTVVEQLIIIPDGMLHYIPFEVLLQSSGSAQESEYGNYQALDFLIKRYPISYSYSATLWLRNSQGRPFNNNGQCLGMAPSIQFSTHQDSLPWTQKELEAIQQFFDGNYFYGAAASKAVFKERAEQYNIIHLATHGIVNMQNPMRSLLSFGAKPTLDEDDQNALYAYEIHNLSLNANLVVLSACETGFGKTVRGEGVLSLARAFLFAGTPSVVTTLWEVNDFTSAALIELFYANLARGMSKPEALRQAKLTFLSKTDEISGHPTYWASFITIGSTDSLQHPNYYNNGWIAIALGFLVFVLLGLAWRIRRRRKA